LRILAIGDIHGIPVVYAWLMEQASFADALILAGDLLEGNVAAGQRVQAAKLVETLRESPVPVLYIMGNDDNVGLEYEDKLIRPLHGRRVEFGQFNFVGYEYTPPSLIGDKFAKSDDEIAADLVGLEALMDERTVFVTHAPAFGTLDECYGENIGSRSIAEYLLRRPVLAHLHGHAHGRFGRDGNHFNLACAGVCMAMLIELPSLEHNVVTYW